MTQGWLLLGIVERKCWKKSVSVLVCLLLLAMPIIGCVGQEEAGQDVVNRDGARAYNPWWDIAWKYRRPVTIDNTQNSGNLADFQILMNLSHDEDMNMDFSDIRFIQFIGATNHILPYWIVNQTDEEWVNVWVKVDSIAGGAETIINVYYGNPAAENASDGKSTFIFFHDFDDDDISDWTTSCEYQNGAETCTHSTDSTHHISPSSSLYMYGKSTCYSSPYNGVEPGVSKVLNLDDGTYRLEFYEKGWGGQHSFCSGGSAGRNYAYNESTRIYDGGCLCLYSGCNKCFTDWEHVSRQINVTGGSSTIKLSVRSSDCMEAKGWFDDLRVRMYATSEPYVSIGDEELPFKFKSIDYAPESPSEGDDVSITVGIENPTTAQISLKISFHIGDECNETTKIDEKDIVLDPGVLTEISTSWTTIGGTHRIWFAVYSVPIADMNITVNRYPTVHPILDQAAVEDVAFEMVVEGEDVDGDDLEWSINDTRFNITSTSNRTAVIGFTPLNEDVGRITLMVTATDPLGKNGTGEFCITVKNTNDPPHLMPIEDQQIKQGETFEYQVEAQDDDLIHNDVLRFMIDPAFVTIDITSGLINFTPCDREVGIHPVKITVMDARGMMDTTNFELEVVNVNDPPTLGKISDKEVTENLLFEWTVSATDPDRDSGDVLEFFDDTELFDIDEESGKISLTPTDDDLGTYTVTIGVRDSYGEEDSAVIEFVVKNVPDAPVLEHVEDLEILEDEEWCYQFVAEDPDPDEKLTFSSDTLRFGVSPNGSVRFTPTNDDVGHHTVSITVTDREGLTDNIFFELTVVNVNDPPMDVRILSPEEGEKFNSGSRIGLSAEASDIDVEDTLTFNWKRKGKVIATGEISSVKLPPGKHLILLEVSDGNATVTKEVSVTVEGIDTEVLGSSSLILPLIVIAVLASIFLALMIARRRKKKKETSPSPQEEDTASETMVDAGTGPAYPIDSEVPPPPPPQMSPVPVVGTAHPLPAEPDIKMDPRILELEARLHKDKEDLSEATFKRARTALKFAKTYHLSNNSRKAKMYMDKAERVLEGNGKS